MLHVALMMFYLGSDGDDSASLTKWSSLDLIPQDTDAGNSSGTETGGKGTFQHFLLFPIYLLRKCRVVEVRKDFLIGIGCSWISYYGTAACRFDC